MDKQVYTKKISKLNLEKSLKNIGFDSSYIQRAVNKYKFNLYKIHNLSCPQASIIKQLALSIGADAAVHREVITCKIEKSDVIIGATDTQILLLAQKLNKQPFKLTLVAKQLLEMIEQKLVPLKIRKTEFDWNKKTYIMGVINVTPDSFSDGGDFFDIESALKQAQKLITDGADIIDIGGESTRPSANLVLPEEEQARVLPIIKKLRSINADIPISIDTRNASTAEAAIEAGADIINDVSGFDWDNDMLMTVKKLKVPVIIMHSLSSPKDMQENPTYTHAVVDEIYFSLMQKIEAALNAGIKIENIIVDPGIGFGKTIEDNLEIIRKANEFKSLGCPLLFGVSRKSFIGEILNNDTADREEANIAVGAYLRANGTNILRVHDVEKHSKAFKVLDEIINYSG